MPLLDAVEQYVRDLPDFRHIPNFHQRLKALIAFQRGWGVHTSSWEDFDVWPEDDPRLWTQVADAFLRLWARGELRVEGYGADGVLQALPPERGDSISANDIDWGRGIIFPGTAREVYGVKVAPVPTTDGATAAQTPAVSAAPKIKQYRYSEAECSRAYLAWVTECELAGKTPSRDEDVDAIRRRLRNFEIPVKHIFALRAKHAPHSWKRSGRR